VIDEQQLLLPFDDPLEEKKEEKQVDWDLPYFENPKTDNERLLNLQYLYKVKGNQQALDEMYKIAIKIAPKLVTKLCKEYKQKIQADDRLEKAFLSVEYIIESYLRKPDWAIRKSWTGYLYLSVKKQILKKRKVDDIVDFVDIKDFYKEKDDTLSEELYNEVLEGNLDDLCRKIFF
jgi:hypothetical protein